MSFEDLNIAASNVLPACQKREQIFSTKIQHNFLRRACKSTDKLSKPSKLSEMIWLSHLFLSKALFANSAVAN
jgi:hypothetical protein